MLFVKSENKSITNFSFSKEMRKKSFERTLHSDMIKATDIITCLTVLFS
jgi:hypothetical protein